MEDHIQINGPINIVRLEGVVYGIKKVLYVFFDIHETVSFEHVCNSIHSLDVNSFVVRELKKSNKTIDFFLEIMESDTGGEKYINMPKNNYILEMRRIFIMERHNKELKNVRYHYIDTREFGEDFFRIQRLLMNDVISFTTNSSLHINVINEWIEIMAVYMNHFNYLHNLLSSNKAVKQQTEAYREKDGKVHAFESSYKLRDDNLVKVANKIRDRYTHPETKGKMVSLFEQSDVIMDEIEKLATKKIKDSLTELTEMTGYDYSTLYVNTVQGIKSVSYGISGGKYLAAINRLVTEINDFTELLSYYSVFMVDMYFIRRFLDKDYVTNGIVYAGAHHSTNYVHTLVHDAGFKITHASYLKTNDANEANSIIKKTPSSEIYKIEELLYPPKLTQCSDMQGFPEGFN